MVQSAGQGGDFVSRVHAKDHIPVLLKCQHLFRQLFNRPGNIARTEHGYEHGKDSRRHNDHEEYGLEIIQGAVQIRMRRNRYRCPAVSL